MKSKNKTLFKKKFLKISAVVLFFALISVFGLSLITGNQDQTNIGSSNASSTEPADINNDNKVDVFDLSILLSKWGTNNTTSDLNKDGTTNVFDLSMMLSKWGSVTTEPPVTTPTKLNINTAWQWQLTGTVDETVLDGSSNPNKMYDIDMFDSSAQLISRLKAKGIYVVCYVESGDWGNWRPDAGDFAPAILGKNISGFPDEKFINVTALDGPAGPTGKTLREIMISRLDLAKSKGCQGIEPDLDDLHTYSTGFTITMADQIAYNTFLINEGHARGMTVGLKNGADEGGATSFTKAMFDAGADWVVNEECNQYSECAGYDIFVQNGRPVFQVEYLDNQRKPYDGATGTCAKNNSANFEGIVKDSSSKLSALPRIACRTGN